MPSLSSRVLPGGSLASYRLRLRTSSAYQHDRQTNRRGSFRSWHLTSIRQVKAERRLAIPLYLYRGTNRSSLERIPGTRAEAVPCQTARRNRNLKKPECQECGTGQPKHPSTRPPVWSSAANLLFEKGLSAALGIAGNLHWELFRFLVRFCVTFPECKQDLLPDVARAYRDGPSSMLNEAAIERPLCHPETLRFLRAYLEGDDPLWKWSLSTCARRMGWLTKDNKPDHARVREILESMDKHGMKGKPGRPKK